VWRISIASTEVGILKPTMTETLRTGLTLKSIETATIHQGESVARATGLRLRFFRGDRIRSAQSVLGPGDKEMIHINACLLTHEDHDADIKFRITNFGHNPHMVKQGDHIGQLIMLGVDEVILEFIAFENETHDFMGSTDTDDDEIIHKTRLGELEIALAAPTVATNKPWKEYPKTGRT
jgi:dUTPase